MLDVLVGVCTTVVLVPILTLVMCVRNEKTYPNARWWWQYPDAPTAFGKKITKRTNHVKV
jgi:hypothetical protein